MDYFTRPVFEFPVDWGNPINKSFSFDLKAVQLGFATPYFTSLQENVVQGYSVTPKLFSDEEINAVDAFTAALVGSLKGFWFPAPFEGMEVSAAVSSTSFDIVYQGLSLTLADDPDVYLYFRAPGFATQCAKILTVVNNGDGTERVTIDTALDDWASLFSSTAFIFKLHYVRLADDKETGMFWADGRMEREIKVIELPEEYARIEAGIQKIFLYRVWCAAPMNFEWRFTNFAADVVSGNVQHTSFPMLHGALTRGLKLDSEKMEVNAKKDHNHPFSLFLPYPFSRPMYIRVFETTLQDVIDGNPATAYFTGRVVSVSDNGDQVVGQCESLWYLQQKVPNACIGASCPYSVYDRRTCKVERAFGFETDAVIVSMSADQLPPDVRISLSFPTLPQAGDWGSVGFWDQGFLVSGLGLNFELRIIIRSFALFGHLHLVLNMPLVHYQAGDTVHLIAGCDRSAATCTNKFRNFINFGAFVDVPDQNPTVPTALGTTPSGGSTK